ncbi:hypothetical protein ACSVH2_12490 [Flavobacterium sp. RSB2_4_14]|uniref:hypothetical protein n=1 Tax=Flavobacterium sp. RSB2_4_14 TaxID=3447665 RepID=UPI003F3AD545
MKKGIILKDIIPFIIWFSSMILGAILIDVILHYYDIVFVGRYLGYLGTATILTSLLYSLDKRNIIKISSPKILLDYHEYLALSGSIMILVHAGIHIHAVLPWLAVLMLLITVISGLTGKHVLAKANQTIREQKKEMKSLGETEEEIKSDLHLDAIIMDSMKNWRKVHVPITYFLALLSIIHIISAILFY